MFDDIFDKITKSNLRDLMKTYNLRVEEFKKLVEGKNVFHQELNINPQQDDWGLPFVYDYFVNGSMGKHKIAKMWEEGVKEWDELKKELKDVEIEEFEDWKSNRVNTIMDKIEADVHKLNGYIEALNHVRYDFLKLLNKNKSYSSTYPSKYDRNYNFSRSDRSPYHLPPTINNNTATKHEKTRMTLHWDEISETVKNLLWGIGWSSHVKVLWAEKAWKGIMNDGLADYHNELERHKVIMRLFSIITLYGEFCSITWEESFSPDYNEWIEEFDLNSIRIGQLVESSFELDEIDEYDLTELSISRLVEKSLKMVLSSISKEFGSFNLLFVGLWLTYDTVEEYVDDDIEIEDGDFKEIEESISSQKDYAGLIKKHADYILNYDTTHKKVETYSWFNGL